MNILNNVDMRIILFVSEKQIYTSFPTLNKFQQIILYRKVYESK